MKNKGFSLVELIVVIAIMAILVGVAVPVYTSYIEKANKSKDIRMVDEVAHALTVYYAANAKDNPNGMVGYVVLTTGDDTDSYGDEVGAAAMEAIFGSEWEQELTLSYDEWTDDGLLNLVAQYDEAALKGIANSTYMTVSTPKGLMSAVTNMTGLVNDVIGGSDLSKATDRLNLLLGDGNNVVSTLENLGIEYTDENYSTVVSNLLVNTMADAIQNNPDSDLVGILTLYSTVYAYSETSSDDSLLQAFNNALASDDLSFDKLLGGEGTSYCESVLSGEDSFDAYLDFMAETVGDSDVTREEADYEALVNMMSAVSMISGTYNDEESLSNDSLYASDKVNEQINNYMKSVHTLANLDPAARAALQNVPAGSVVVFVAADGTITVLPSAAWGTAD